jgi:hypothetical protein
MNRRTTVNADSESLSVLEDEAKRRGDSLSAVLAEAISEKAIAILAVGRPRLGLGRSTDGSSAAETATDPIARPPH